MKKDEELKVRTLMNTLKGARAHMARKGNNFAVEIKVEKKKAEYHVPRKVATKRWNSGRNMDVDEGKLELKNKLGALTVEEEEEYEAYIGCQPYGGNCLVFAGRGWGI